ncbi:MAG TPA: class I SAM-dependent methyltransferase [Polyangiaceae bacterium]|jgi:SAM-dependent methyltransferase
MARMTLPDVEGLAEAPAELWTDLGRRFRAIGFTSTAAVPFAKLSVFGPDPRRAAMAKWHLRRIPEPHAIAMRMLMFWDPVTPDEARRAFGDGIPLERLLDAGFVVRSDDGILGAFVMQLLADLYVVSDDLRLGGDVAMGASPSTKSLAAAVRPVGRAGRALDLGCGAGTLALAMAQKCGRVVATDINARAVSLARMNAALNGLGNVDCRVGDLFAPVADETFDLIACQPPYVAHDEDSGPTAFLFGGPRGDELTMRMVEGIVARLAPGGTAFVMAEWPVVDGDPPLDTRIASALGSREVSSLFLQSRGADIDEHCARYALVRHSEPDGGYEEAAMRRREHFERMRIRALQPMLTVVRRGPERAAWSSVVDVGQGPLSRARIDAMFAARDLVSGTDEALLAARLRVPEKASFPADEVLAVVNVCSDVREAVARIAGSDDRRSSEVETEVLDRVKKALLASHVEVAGG